uniref:Macaca fascicularis brain cDNA clone: QflA-17337, similar to human hypothetical protein FLJ39885 (FLJ39885), mRNA, RefSeq: XM_374489.2 n=1 Tax=Macaca fascicularis TaxID=9541 RepID=I7GHT5_MACFA|nr:unnamed protein product [Macaca fascicularis]
MLTARKHNSFPSWLYSTLMSLILQFQFHSVKYFWESYTLVHPGNLKA